LVLGMHRSGTSAVTRVLNLLGAGLGGRLMAPVAGDNEKGYWENLDALDINERLLTGIGRSWHDVREMPRDWQESIAAVDGYAAVMRFVKAEFATSPLWAVKDPRMCRLAPVWLRALADCGVQPGILFVVRHPLEVAASLYARNGWSRARSLLLWTHHVLEAERATRGCPRAVVTYNQILTNWCGAMERASDTLGLAWLRTFDQARVEIEAFLDVGQRHHHTSPAQADAATASGIVPALVAEIFEQYMALSTNHGAWGHLQTLADEFARSSAIYGVCFDDLAGYAGTGAEALVQPDMRGRASEPSNVRSRSLDGDYLETVSQCLSQQSALLERLSQQDALLERLSQLVTDQWVRIGSLEDSLAAGSETLKSLLAGLSQKPKPELTDQLPYISQQLEKVTRLLAAQADRIGGVEGELIKVRRAQLVSRLPRWLRRADE
jgi:hypothetical protein